MRLARQGMLIAVPLTVLALAVTGCSSSGNGGGSGSGSTIKIGVLQDKSGIVAASSAKAIEGLKTAVAAINSGDSLWAKDLLTANKVGINGRKIELVYEDTQANPNLALLAARKLASKKVAAIIGTTTSPDAIQAKVACEQSKVPCVFPSVSAAAIVAPPNNGYAFTLAPSFDVQAQQLALGLKAAHLTRIALAQDDSGTADTVVASFVTAFKAAGISIVDKEVLPANAQDATAQVQRLKAKNADGVLDLVVPVPLNVTFVKQLHASAPSMPLFGINTLIEPGTVKQMGDALDKAVAIDQFDVTSPSAQEFSALSKKDNPSNQPVGATQIYMATALLIVKYAIEKANSTDGKDVKDQMEKITEFPAGFGQKRYTVNWTADNHNGSGPGGVVFVQFSGTTTAPWTVFQPSAG